MGCTFEQGKDYPRIGTPVHEVRLTQDYWLGKYEVTQAQWEKVMGKNPSYANTCPNYPVEHVFWKDVEEFLSRLNAELKKKNSQARAFYRLPAEAKWEHAARGGARAVATRYAGSNTAGEVLWYAENSEKRSHPVGDKVPNELGFYDMSGNVWELCSDHYGPYTAAGAVDPQGPAKGINRVLRGGGWNSGQGACRIAARIDFEERKQYIDVGFRLCLSIPGVTNPVPQPDKPQPPTPSSFSIVSAAVARVAENTPVVTAVYTAQVASAPAAVSFSLDAAQKDNGLFNINASTGVITFKAAPDYENPADADKDNIYDLTITGTSGDKTATKAVTVIVTNVVETPVFTTGLSATHEIDENLTSVGYNTMSTPTKLLVSPNTKDVVRFSLPTAATGYEDNDKLSINPTTGALRFITAPDYETPLGGATDNSNDYKVRMAAAGGTTGAGGRTVNHDFTIRVTDESEAPVISSAESQNVPENTTTTAYTATVANAAKKDAVRFSLPPDLLENDKFTIDATTGAVTFKTLPDFENPGDSDKNNVYVIQLTATASETVGGITRTKTDTKVVRLRVTDINEAPVFTSGTAVSVKERRRLAYRAEATDPDAGDNITFALTAGSATFELSGNQVRFITPPTFNSTTPGENTKTFTLSATDDNATPLSATQTVTVTITDEADDTAPAITSGNGTADATTGHKATATLSVKERTPATPVIYTATATDDGGGGITYELTAGTATFELLGNSVRFKTTLTFDNTTAANNIHTFTITARDEAHNAATQTVTVTITDLDDTAPQFTSGSTAPVTIITTDRVTAPENTGIATVVYTATANERATFSAAAGTGNDNALFNIPPYGAVTFKDPPDYEKPADADKNNEYILHLHATDVDNNQTATHLTLTITVTDVTSEPAYTDPYTGMAFEKVEKGTFTMGGTSEQGADAGANESPTHSVTFTQDYLMGKYEVTQAEWKKVMTGKPTYFTFTANRDNHPVRGVTNYNIQYFLKKLNAELKKNNPNTKWVYRLPTEAEWEYAARGGQNATATSGPGATKYAGSNTVGDVAWYSVNSGNKTHPVGQKDPNELGLYDMNGNVWEWVFGQISDYSNAAKTDPAPAGIWVRGGSYAAAAKDCRVANRGPARYLNHIHAGFRVCLSQDNTPPKITSAGAISVHENVLTFYTATATDYVSTITGMALTFSLPQGARDNDFFTIDATTGAVAFKTPPDFENPADADKDNVYVVQFSVTDVAGNTATKTVRVTVTDRPEDYTDAYTGMAFQKVEKGTFTMGCTAEQGIEFCYHDTPHSVTLTKDYYIGKYEVTQAQWRKVMGSSHFKNCDNCPVEQVSWDDVQAFLFKLNAQLKKTDPGTQLKYRLPTEAEWEYAARGGHKATSTSPTSGAGATKYAGSNEIDEVAWHTDNSGNKTHPVGQKAPNELGLYDMSGNVWEWCLDRYGSYSSGAKTDPKGPSSGWFRVLRGGSCNRIAWYCRVSYRNRYTPGERYKGIGFRLCLSLDNPPVITSAATATAAENTMGVYKATATDDHSFAADITFSLAGGVKDNDLFTFTGTAITFKTAPDFENPADADKNNVYELELTATDKAGNASRKVVSITVTDVANEPGYVDSFTGMAFEKVQKGTFTMGATTEQDVNVQNNEKPTHSVTFTKDYYIGKYEVTQAQWRRVMGSNPSHFTAANGGGDNHPVEKVNWNDVQNFLSRLNAELKKNKPNTKWVYRLPTEAEWEYAARGGQNANATKYAGSNNLGHVAWYYIANSPNKTRPVGQKAPNKLGLYDMSGNLWEWVYDWISDYSNAAKTDPKGPSSGTKRVLRGGSWANGPESCRVAFRGFGSPGERNKYYSFRVCLSQDNTPPKITSAGAISVHENVLGTFYTATATDYVSTITGMALTFSLPQGARDNDFFTIDATTGAVAFKTPPDFENPADADKGNIYVVQFTVTDVAGNTATKTVSVTVTDRPEDYTDAYTGMAFEKVQKGTFTMGATTEQGANVQNNEKPTHSVTFTKDYYIGKYEVTQAQWRKVMGSNSSHFKNCDNCPVEQVSWNDVQAFLFKLNAQLKKAKSNIKLKYRLPTEAEWEYAARGGQNATATRYAGSNEIDEVAWHTDNSGNKTHPVGQKAPNELGLYDMSGNLWEWCLDRYGSYSSGAKTDPKGPSTGPYRVVRGGGWANGPESCRVAFRGLGSPGERYYYYYYSVGFRLCLSLDNPPVITSAAVASAAENTIIGVVYTAAATDDVSAAADISFSLAGGVKDNDFFTLTGTAITFKTAPDFENPADADKNNVYELELTATDKAGNASRKVVSITVTDVANEPGYVDSFTGMGFEKVEKGTFTMGCTSEQSNCSDNEKPTHQVTLTQDYLMGKYEVTQAQWVKVMGSNPSHFTATANGGGDNHPVEKVSWNDVQRFIAKLNAELKKAKPNIKLKYRLPTEAEWEYAARGGNKSKGYKYAGSNTLGNVAWYSVNSGNKTLLRLLTFNRVSINSGNKTHPVGQKAPNELGLYDMSGNVWEWCSDWWNRDYTSASVTDPKGPSTGQYRVLRGGSWGGSARFCRVSSRDHINPGLRNLNLGFRLCLGL